MVTLDKFNRVPASAWVGTTAINYGGRTYNVPSNVLIWNRDGGSWFTDGVDAAIRYGGSINLYIKDGIIRAIEACLIAVAIALGAGVTMSIWLSVSGGA